MKKTSVFLAVLTLLVAAPFTSAAPLAGGDTLSGGTSCVTTNASGQTTVAALTGTVNLTLPDGTTLKIDAGTGAQLNADGTVMKDASGNTVRPLAALLAGESGSALKAAILAKVTEIATNVTAAQNTAGQTQAATTQLAAVMKLMAQVDPAGTPELITAAVSTLTKNGADSTTVTNAVSAVVAGAASGGMDSTAITAAASTGAGQNGVTLNPNVVNVTTATDTVNNNNVLTSTPQPIVVSAVSAG